MERGRLQATYVGGPTALFEWCGFRLLTDPTFDPPGGKYENGPVVLEKTIGPAIAPETLGGFRFCSATIIISTILTTPAASFWPAFPA